MELDDRGWSPDRQSHKDQGGLTVIVCGLRNLDVSKTRKRLAGVLSWYDFSISRIVHGDAPGADTAARKWAEKSCVECVAYPARWSEHGRAAGPIRNQEMLDAELPELVIAFWDGKSRGTGDMVRRTIEFGTPILIESVDGLFAEGDD